MRRHSWQRVRAGKHCCRQCGMVRLSVPYRNVHRLQYERMRSILGEGSALRRRMAAGVAPRVAPGGALATGGQAVAA